MTSTMFYGSKRKVIVVSRDPKAIFSGMRNRNSLSYPGNDIKIFVEWYKNIMDKIDDKQHKKVIKIRYEKFLKILKPSLKNFVNYLGSKVMLIINLIWREH